VPWQKGTSRVTGSTPQSPVIAARCIFVNRYFHPDHSASSQLLSDLAFALAAQGKAVAVITSRQHYDAPEVRLPSRETVRRVEVHRVWTTSFGRHYLVGRTMDYVTFYLSAATSLWRLLRKGGIVVAKTDPPMLSILAVPVARLRGAKVVNWLQDIFPEVAESLGLGRGRIARAVFGGLRALRNRSLHHAAMNVVVGERMADKLEALGIDRTRIRIISNWADGTLINQIAHPDNPLRATWGLEGKFVVGHSGNLGRAHDYTTLLDAIARLEADRVPEKSGRPFQNMASVGAEALERRRFQTGIPSVAVTGGERGPQRLPDILWLFIGGGANYRVFEAEVRRAGLTSVQFQPYQPRERLSESLCAADVHLVSLKPELEGLIVPSKYYGIAAAGRAAIFVGDADGEIGRILAQADAGCVVAPGDGVGLAACVADFAKSPQRVSEMGSRARSLFAQRFDVTHAVVSWTSLLEEVSRL
jgi:glycosyltransferase involved in cell wall biosynthesis